MCLSVSVCNAYQLIGSDHFGCQKLKTSIIIEKNLVNVNELLSDKNYTLLDSIENGN